MNTRLLLSASAIAMGLGGLALIFLPEEIAGVVGGGAAVLPLQLLGAAWFGFAMVNWHARGNAIGGIFGRPLALGNLAHFMVGAFTLIREVAAQRSSVLLVAGILYVAFAAAFAWVLTHHPARQA